VIAYAVIGLVTWIVVAIVLIFRDEDSFTASALGFLAAIAWPISWAIAIIAGITFGIAGISRFIVGSILDWLEAKRGR
jgi:hypothetical protein